uniref:Uncharacterized protein n=1 Tax=Arundo donax TaxID=35708 RepID=A0A0A9B1Y8_ARUDO
MIHALIATEAAVIDMNFSTHLSKVKMLDVRLNVLCYYGNIELELHKIYLGH